MDKNETKQEELKIEKTPEQSSEEKQSETQLDEMQKKKIVCCIAYLFNILFFIPLLMFPNDEFSKFHANQSLIILIGAVVVSVLCTVGAFIPVVGIVFSIIGGLIGVVVLAAIIFGIISVVNEEKKELPFVGKYRIIK